MHVRKAEPSDVEALTGALARAFDADPFANYFVRGDARRADGFSRLFGQALRYALPVGEVHTTDDAAGAALWFPPGAYRLRAGAVPGLVASLVRVVGAGRLVRVLSGANQVGRVHPKEPHWYLFMFGVDPPSQGRGLGGTLLRHALARIDAEHMPAYLETATEDNVALYRRFGFDVRDEVQVPSGGPRMWTMWRAAK
jgi:ribosomal protein S18 acetylase RimI-like enzyme